MKVPSVGSFAGPLLKNHLGLLHGDKCYAAEKKCTIEEKAVRSQNKSLKNCSVQSQKKQLKINTGSNAEKNDIAA